MMCVYRPRSWPTHLTWSDYPNNSTWWNFLFLYFQLYINRHETIYSICKHEVTFNNVKYVSRLLNITVTQSIAKYELPLHKHSFSLQIPVGWRCLG